MLNNTFDLVHSWKTLNIHDVYHGPDFLSKQFGSVKLISVLCVPLMGFIRSDPVTFISVVSKLCSVCIIKDCRTMKQASVLLYLLEFYCPSPERSLIQLELENLESSAFII